VGVFDTMDEVMIHKPSTVPESVVDSLAFTQPKENFIGTSEQLDEVDETFFGGDSDAAAPVPTASPSNRSSTNQEKAFKKRSV